MGKLKKFGRLRELNSINQRPVRSYNAMGEGVKKIKLLYTYCMDGPLTFAHAVWIMRNGIQETEI